MAASNSSKLPLMAIAIVFIFVKGVRSATLTFKNNCQFTIWPGTLAGHGSTALSSTGFELAPGATMSLDAPAPWSGRFWPRTHCTTDFNGKFKCATGDCGSGQVPCKCNGGGGNPPVTLIEFMFGAGGAQDFYDVSLVDSFNLPVSIQPSGGSGNCSSMACGCEIVAVEPYP